MRGRFVQVCWFIFLLLALSHSLNANNSSGRSIRSTFRFFMINFGVIHSKCIKLKGESLNHSHEKVEKIIPHITLNVFMICWSFVISSANFSLFFRMGNVSHVRSSTNLENGLPAQLSVFKRISDNSTSPNLFFFLSHFMRDSKKWKEKAAAWQEIRYSLVSFSFFVKSYKSSR